MPVSSSQATSAAASFVCGKGGETVIAVSMGFDRVPIQRLGKAPVFEPLERRAGMGVRMLLKIDVMEQAGDIP